MKAFPHLVEMQKRFADKGLVVIAVSLDEADKKEFVDAANSFLRRENPPFVKLLLNEPHGMWSKRLGFTIPPCYYIFDRNGRWVRFPEVEDEDPDYDKMDRTIIQMLDAK